MTTVLRNIAAFRKNRIPGQLVIQFTNQCNARCPQCGMRVTADFPRSTLAVDGIKRMLDAAARQGVQAVSFTGGEPLLHLDHLIDLIDYAGKAGIAYIRTGTNGFLFRNSHKAGFMDRMRRLADRLAATPLRNFWISLDSAYPHVHENMRGLDGVVAGIEKALPVFHAAGLYPSANLGINRQVGGPATALLRAGRDTSPEVYLGDFYTAFKTSFDKFYRLTADLGFTIVNTCYPMSIDTAEQADGLSAVYAATAVDDIVRFSRPEKGRAVPCPDGIPFRPTATGCAFFTPLSSLRMLCRQYGNGGVPSRPAACRGRGGFLFCGCPGRQHLSVRLPRQ